MEYHPRALWATGLARWESCWDVAVAAAAVAAAAVAVAVAVAVAAAGDPRRPPATPRDPPRHQHMSKYGSYDPYIAQHMSKYGSYDPNIAQHRKKYRKFENPKFRRKFQMFKMTQKSFSAYPKIPKSDFSKFIDFYIKSRTSIPSGGVIGNILC